MIIDLPMSAKIRLNTNELTHIRLALNETIDSHKNDKPFLHRLKEVRQKLYKIERPLVDTEINISRMSFHGEFIHTDNLII